MLLVHYSLRASYAICFSFFYIKHHYIIQQYNSIILLIDLMLKDDLILPDFLIGLITLVQFSRRKNLPSKCISEKLWVKFFKADMFVCWPTTWSMSATSLFYYGTLHPEVDENCRWFPVFQKKKYFSSINLLIIVNLLLYDIEHNGHNLFLILESIFHSEYSCNLGLNLCILPFSISINLLSIIFVRGYSAP